MDFVVGVVRGVHAIYVAFVVTAPGCLWSGIALRSRALGHPAIGVFHLLCLSFAIVQLGLGWACPLSVLESRVAGLPPVSYLLPDAWSAPAAVPGWFWLAVSVALVFSAWTTHVAHRQRSALERSTC